MNGAINPYKSLVRYELMVILIWIFVELARWIYLNKAHNSKKDVSSEAINSVENSQNTSWKKQFRSASWMVLFGALIGVLIYWLIVEIWLRSWFYGQESNLSTSSNPTTNVSYRTRYTNQGPFNPLSSISNRAI